ncbi:hypothetical protein [Peribacillus simplex]|uniref:hypothetical protein n=1 Tax=Peribacillus simplex TaxID=1478 RepID=UPI003D2B4C8D
MIVGLANIKYVDRDKVIDILEKKAKSIKALWEQLGNSSRNLKATRIFVNFLDGYFSTRTDHTIYWFEELIKGLRQRNCKFTQKQAYGRYS